MSTKSPELFLSPDQRALLLAALNSNTPLNSQPRSSPVGMKESSSSDSLNSPQKGDSSFDTSLFTDADALADVDYNFDLTDYSIGEFGLESAGDHEKRKLSIEDAADEEADPHETEPKRREGDDKTAKKPGRKPITNEPTSKRKAQNRAAQRAFRERKEKHLKDLEQKVQDLEKISESTNQENKALKEQVDKLQSELKEYRKRFSMGGGGSGLNRSPSNSISNNMNSLDGGLSSTGGFSFDFPLFGSFSAPGQNVVGGNRGAASSVSPTRANNISPTNYRVAPGGILEIDRTNRPNMSSASPQTPQNHSPAVRSNSNSFTNGVNHSPLQVHRVSVDEPKFNPTNDILSELFSPSILQAVNNDLGSDYLNKGTGAMSSSQSTPHMSSLFSFSDSPSASSVSQHSLKNGQNNSSSCGTTPEAMDAASPPSQNKADGSSRLNSISEEGEQTALPNRQHRGSSVGDVTSFCEMLGQACGSPNNPLPAAGRILPPQDDNTATATSTAPAAALGTDNSFAWFAAQNGGSFEPNLFNDYRDPGSVEHQQAPQPQHQPQQPFPTVGMSYFDDAFPSAFDLTLPPTPPASSVDKLKNTAVPHAPAPGLQEEDDDEEEVVPADEPNSFLKCNQIWDKVQSHPKFVSGEIDMDNLCSELRAKAKCSEKGVVVDKKDVDTILNKPIPSMWGL
ncbi:DNA-binding transcription factor yap1 [Orbilia brochopaga]|uniref:DNA-binding transcription factor yap1 n=1 Tax=Orbilia brochopaga TaxID=3140254 RepID=A0AAV9V8C3_9PEZI